MPSQGKLRWRGRLECPAAAPSTNDVANLVRERYDYP